MDILPKMKEIEKDLNELSNPVEIKEEVKPIKKQEPKQETQEPIKDIITPDDDTFNRAKEYLKEQWYKWYWLLKWINMINKAIENWFTI